MLRSAKAGKSVNLDDMPPPVFIKEASAATKEAPPSQDKPRPPSQDKPRPQPQVRSPPKPTPPSNLIDLDAPEFDEFNLTEEELASMAASMVDDRSQSGSAAGAGIGSSTKHSSPSSSVATASHSSLKSGPSPSPSPSLLAPAPSLKSGSMSSVGDSQAKPQPKPRPKPHPQQQAAPLPMKPGGLIDLDDPAFDEFTLTDEDLEAMASAMVDDRQQLKKPKIEEDVNTPSPAAASPSSSFSSASGQGSRPPPPSDTPPRAAPRVKPPPQPSSPQTPTTQQQKAMPTTTPTTRSLPATLKKPMSAGSDKSVLVSFLQERMEQYQLAAKQAQQRDPKCNKEYRLIAAKFSRVVKGVESGQEIDLSQMPGPPPGFRSSYDIDVKQFSLSPSSSKPAAQTATKGQSSTSLSGVAGSSRPEGEESDDGPPPADPEIPLPKSALEALEQRMAKYREGLKTAQEKGESSRVRRMGRIIKQYESAIRDTKAGRACDYADLPTPPGYPPIPAAAARPVKRPAANTTSPVPLPTQSLPPRSSASSTPTTPSSRPPPASATPSISQQQLQLCESRLTELKRAAKMEQSAGNRDGALELMKRAKGLETMIRAAQSGLPVNLEQVPPSPFADKDGGAPSPQVVSHLRPAQEGDEATFDLITSQLEKQVEICDRNAETYKKMGSNAAAIEYENMSRNSQRELLALKGIQGAGFGPPKFSLEMRTLTIIHSNAHLTSAICEVEVSKALNITRPPKYEEKDMDVYVEVEFPYPTEAPPKKSTEVVHKSCSPEFKEQGVMLFDIDRKHHRSMVRAFKRTPLKCTAWQHRSLRKHIFLGEHSP